MKKATMTYPGLTLYNPEYCVTKSFISAFPCQFIG